MNIGYYHTYLTDNPAIWLSVVMEQFKIMEDSGLVENLDRFIITAITQDDRRTHYFKELCESYNFNNLEIHFVNNSHKNDCDMLSLIESTSTTEVITLKRLWQECQRGDFNVLYFHSKAITGTDKLLNNSDMKAFKRSVYWRQYLNWGVLEKWEECVKRLDKYDVSGVNYSNDPIPHYSGNFWWAKSSHIRRLPDPETNDWWHLVQANATDQWLKYCPLRYKDEQWVTHLKDTKMFNVEGVKDNPAFTITPRRLYA
jgi:hypothetical protein